MEEELESKNLSVTQSAFRVMFGGGLSLVAGLATQVATASLFGAGALMDAYLTAQVIPVYVQWALLSGLAFVLIPAFVDEETRGHEETAWSIVGTMFWLTAAALAVITLAGVLFSGQITALVAPGFAADKAASASSMLSILMFSVPFAGLSSLTAGIQNARNRFFWPAAATGVGSLGNVVCLLVLTPLIGPSALAWGYLIASILQAVTTIAPVLRHGWKRLIPLRDPRMVSLGKTILPFVLFGFLNRSPWVFERYFASWLPESQISYLGYANKIANIFVVLIAGSIASAIFPTLARTFSLEGRRGLAGQTEYGLRLTLSVSIPAVLLVGAIAVPAVRVFLQRGAFTEEDTLRVSAILMVIMLGEVFFRMLGNVVSRSLYVMKDTLAPLAAGAASAVLYILGGSWFARQWGYVGLAWAHSLQSGVMILFTLFLLAYRLKVLNMTGLLRDFARYSAAAAAAYLASRLVLLGLSGAPALMQLAAAALVGGFSYLGLLYWIDPKMLASILEMFGMRKLVNLFGQKPGEIQAH